MATSQNGWPASTDKASIGIDSSVVIPGTSVKFPQGVKKGAVATVLMYVAGRLHREVEPAHSTECWGYNYRPIRGQSTGLSNHSSGTAIDYNASEHPLAAVGTWTKAQVTQIHSILSFCEGAVRWGGDYDGRKDEMHFEINTSASHLATIAKKITDSQEDTLSAAEVTEIKAEIDASEKRILAAISSERATNEAYQHDNDPKWPQPGANDHLLEGQKALLKEAGLDPAKVYTGPKK